jgi:MoaA/NifB/PqqE/SkfB family radical SAM enzyme
MKKENKKKLADFLAKQVINLASITKAWKILLPPLEKIAYKLMVTTGDPVKVGPRRQREDKFYMASNIVRAAFKAHANGSYAVKDRMINLFLKQFLTLSSRNNEKEYEKRYSMESPNFITISPGGTCNLRCKDCYAASVTTGLPSLSYETVDKILKEKYEKWGSWFTVVSGGEPFLWKDGCFDIIDVARFHPEQYFLIYTNGTLIDEKKAKRIAEVGNITTAISVEGFEKETDERRGKGVFNKILTAFENLRNAGVPFGISVTANHENAEFVISKEMIDFYFKKQGALYQWVFQYMPIGRGMDVDRQVSPEIRTKMWKREQELVYKERLFVVDFWNGGTFSSGCIAGGRPGGYLYIDWNGNIYPCVFVPYWKDNINDLYLQGKTLTDALFSNLFKGIRDWQLSYNYMCQPNVRGNEIRPCFIRDHYEKAHDILIKTESKYGYEMAGICLHDQDYYDKMKQYDEKLAELLDPVWQKLYQEPLKTKEKLHVW